MLASENAVLLPAWRVAETTDTVTFRHRENAKATRASWDVRVAVDREVIDGKGGPDLVKLTPKDPSIAFTKLVAYYELDPQPYVVLDDFDFVGRVGRAKSPDPQLGDHLAMYEAVGTDRPANPRLHEFFRQGYRGPYAADDGPRPPWGFVAREDFDRPVGAVVRLRLKADPRGNDFVHINRTGGAEVPPWDFMLDVNTLVIRHESDASKDLLLQVEPEHDGSRVRLEPVDESWADFRRLAKMNEYSGPFVRVPDQFFAAEVHSDTRVSKAFEGRRTLVPLHPLGQAQGPFGTLPYRPHPSELLDFGMTGPYLGEEGGTLVASRFEQVGPRWGAIVIGWVGLVFAISSIALWSEYAARALGAVLGGFAGTVGKVAVLIAAAMGGTLALPAVLGWSDAALAAAILPNLVALVIALPALRALMNSEQRGDGPS
jgi:hypothetical protein